MDTSFLQHPKIDAIVTALVTERGGCVEYDTGAGGREILACAGARLAADIGAPLAVVDSPALHDDIATTVTALEPGVACTLLSAEDPSSLPTNLTGAVLAVHADVLRDQAAREPLHALARTAAHLIVVRHDNSNRTLDALAGRMHAVRIHDLLGRPAPQPPVPAPDRSRPLGEAATRLAAQIYALDEDLATVTSPVAAEQLRLRREGMVESLCIMLEVYADTTMVFAAMAEQVVAGEGARRYRTSLDQHDLTHWRLHSWARERRMPQTPPSSAPLSRARRTTPDHPDETPVPGTRPMTAGDGPAEPATATLSADGADRNKQFTEPRTDGESGHEPCTGQETSTGRTSRERREDSTARHRPLRAHPAGHDIAQQRPGSHGPGPA
ncbi:hypothetical protein OIE69_44570 (plasmid) [Actinacidiphila glaucinigra]|uniref:hypothetical protein n=1 Tax=Actinacidiphila glaucinigra TaxID=235986 RepID=UPI002DD7FAAC|nr:hypothetical protein [Actinacidiphila glaucinigra]WSD65732.1 hypothetical protein OIE69_43280 [Actinacidiphila glaucinigra]WSD65980.1 hypothetical protein OIE69_44570 [Actinacidiphila glaucinigra]